jgi:hypothetical protein
MKKFLLAAIAAIALCAAAAPAFAQAHAADTLLEAVTFVLTGKDIGDIRIVDRAGCIFERTSFSSRQSPVLTERYYLNNVDLSRVTLRGPLTDGFNFYHWIDENIRGQGVVYEYTNQSGTHQQSEFSPNLQTAELGRVQRAWRYIYTHGCRSAASAY